METRAEALVLRKWKRPRRLLYARRRGSGSILLPKDLDRVRQIERTRTAETGARVAVERLVVARLRAPRRHAAQRRERQRVVEHEPRIHDRPARRVLRAEAHERAARA